MRNFPVDKKESGEVIDISDFTARCKLAHDVAIEQNSLGSFMELANEVHATNHKPTFEAKFKVVNSFENKACEQIYKQVGGTIWWYSSMAYLRYYILYWICWPIKLCVGNRKWIPQSYPITPRYIRLSLIKDVTRIIIKETFKNESDSGIEEHGR